MNILAFDTATQSCSIALVADGKLVAESTSDKKGTHAKRVMPMIDALLQHVNLKISAIDGFATTIGPGSFTGLRIGISTLKGLAAATRKPVVGVSALEALAHQCRVETEMICPLLDARKGEVYYCRYRRRPGGLDRLTSERSAAPAEAVAGIAETCAFIGDGVGVYRDVIASVLGRHAVFALDHEHVIRAGTLAELGYRRLVQGSSDDPLEITPHYIRKSDAKFSSP